MLILGTGDIATRENQLEWVLGTFAQFLQFTCGLVGVLSTMSNNPLAPSVGTLAGTREPKFGMDTAHR
jgi:hypothetical protein